MINLNIKDKNDMCLNSNPDPKKQTVLKFEKKTIPWEKKELTLSL